jgi:dTDP-4-dehydrorhamnose 3,5-epimerase
VKVTKTKLPGVVVIEPEVLLDKRGFFKETFRTDRYNDVGITLPFIQENYSRSQKGVLRGLHLQKSKPQGKLISCSLGCIYDVAVDINPKSKTFGNYVGVELSEQNHLQFWIPPGYAHGFCVLSKYADLNYKCTNFYFPEDEGGLIWNDPEVAIDWPIKSPLLSKKDKLLPSLNEIKKKLIVR